MHSYWAFVFIGANNSGKSTVQRNLVNQICSQNYKHLPTNQIYNVTNNQLSKVAQTIFVMGRSIQEQSTYSCVCDFFESRDFKYADICILSSHSGSADMPDVADFIKEARRQIYNVAGVFFGNNTYEDLQNLAELDWDERLWLPNDWIPNAQGKGKSNVNKQLQMISNQFQDFLIRRSATW